MRRLRELCDLGFDVGDFLVEARDAIAMGADIRVQRIALGGERRECGRQLGENLLRLRKRRFRFAHALVDAAAQFDLDLDLVLERRVFGIEPRQRHVRIRRQPLLALDVGRKLRQPPVELAHALARAGFLAIQRLARIGEALQACGRARFALAQARQIGGPQRLQARGLGLFARAFGEFTHREIMRAAGIGHVRIGGDPAQVEQHCLGFAHLGRDLAIADRLPRLPLQSVDLAGELADHVLDAGQVGFCSFQPKLGLVPARMQAGDARGVFQHAAALLGLCLDDFADAALMHQRRRTGAGRGVRKQDLHVAGAHLASVDAIGGTRLALDPARDVEVVLVVDRRRRRALAVVDGHRHFGVIARGAIAGAREDHRIHVGGAQRLVRRLAHHPAERFHQVRLAAAVRSDDAGQSRFDMEIGRLNEGLEAVQAEARQFHGRLVLSAGKQRIADAKHRAFLKNGDRRPPARRAHGS